MLFCSVLTLLLLAYLQPLPATEKSGKVSSWLKVDDFESTSSIQRWTLVDSQNETQPRLENPQITEVRTDALGTNNYLLKKPAPEGVVGNRKALSFIALPVAINVGETYTFYARINVEAFPNNHVFGLSNLPPSGIIENAYEALEPSLRITDRFDANTNFKNDGTLSVRKDDWYDRIFNINTNNYAKPMLTNTWYEIWMVVNNNTQSKDGQVYDIYISGGEEFPSQQKVYSGADFRMKRELPIMYFFATCNTGPADKPYGNGGLRFDDLYMAPGVNLISPIVGAL